MVRARPTLTLPGFVHDVCSAVHPLAAGSPAFASFPLAEHGLEWIHPPLPLAHPLDDGSAVVMARSLDETCARLGADGARYRRAISPLVRSLARTGADDPGAAPAVAGASLAAGAVRSAGPVAGGAAGSRNRSARVERPFWFIETNFLAGRTFNSWQDLNQQARQWCDKVNSTYKKHLRAVPRELFSTMEQQHLRPLPVWVPKVSRLHERAHW